MSKQTFIVHLQQVTGQQNFTGGGAQTDIDFNDLAHWTNDFGVPMDLVAITGLIELLPNIDASVELNLQVQLQLSFAAAFGPVHEIFRHHLFVHQRTTIAPDVGTIVMTNPNFILGNFNESICDVPTHVGVVSETQEQPRSTIHLNGTSRAIKDGAPDFVARVRFLANIYLKKK